MRLLIRFLVIILLLVMIKNSISSEPDAFISWSEANFVDKLEWEIDRIRRAAQDLPATIDIVLRRLFGDLYPITEAKAV